MKWLIRSIALKISKLFSLDLMLNISGLVALKNFWFEIKKTPYFSDRIEMWSYVMEKYKDKKILFLEFGVHKGFSIDKFSKMNNHSNSIFIGFDSFEGLPKNWRNFITFYKKNHFDTGGVMPTINDNRVSFIKGWFSDTLPKFIEGYSFDEYEEIVVHLDADLYSSTFYVMLRLSEKINNFTIIFDELPGEEARALNDFIDIFGSKVSFLAYQSGIKSFPMKVACRFNN